MSSSAKPPKTPEELDEEELREVEAKMKEVLDLMTARHRRDDTDARVLEARARRQRQCQQLLARALLLLPPPPPPPPLLLQQRVHFLCQPPSSAGAASRASA
jgi:hypothetical protein